MNAVEIVPAIPGQNPPFGYIKDPTDKNRWIIKKKAAAVVREIFDLCIAGYGPSQISSIMMKKDRRF